MHFLLSRQLWPDLLAGVIAALVFCILYAVPLLMYLPAFMLMLCGLCYGAGSGQRACFAACLTVLLLLGLQGAVFFAFIIGLPSAFFVRRALLWRGAQSTRQWYPVERILAELTVLIAAFFMAMALMVSMDSHEGQQALAVKAFSENLNGVDADTASQIREMTTHWSFAFFALAGWVWVLLLYGFAVLANRVLRRRDLALRENLAISWRGLPAWYHCLAAIAAFLACFGSGNDRYCGQMIFLLLLLPYGLAGAARTFSFLKK